MEDRVGGADQLERPRRHQARVARAGADQVDDPAAGAHRGALRQKALGALEDVARPGGLEPLGEQRPGRRRLLDLELDPVADPLGAIREPDEGIDREALALELGVDSDRAGAGRVENRDDRPLRCQLDQRPLVADRRRRLDRVTVPDSGLQHQRPLPRGRCHHLGRDRERGLPVAAQAPQPGGGEDNRLEIVLGQPAQPGVDVAVQLPDLEVRPRGEELCPSAQARGPDPGALGHRVQRGAGPDPDVGGVLAHGDGGNRQALRHRRRQVLGRVDADLGLTRQQRRLDPADEPGLVAQLAVGGDLDQLSPAEQPGHPLGLGERQGTPPGREANRHPRP